MSDILLDRISEALRLIVEAETLRQLGTRQSWAVVTQYERAAKLLGLAAGACEARGRACWSYEGNVKFQISNVKCQRGRGGGGRAAVDRRAGGSR